MKITIGEKVYVDDVRGTYRDEEGGLLTCYRCDEEIWDTPGWEYNGERGGPCHQGRCPRSIREQHGALERSVVEWLRREGWTIEPPHE